MIACHYSNEEQAECPVVCRSFLKAVAETYPAAAILDPAYAADGFLNVLQTGYVIDFAAARSLHEHFPELHSVKQSCRWHCIPDSWTPFLKQLAERVIRLRSQVSAASRSVSADAIACEHSMPLWTVCDSV